MYRLFIITKDKHNCNKYLEYGTILILTKVGGACM